MSKQEFTFFATFGHGQPGFPGYLRITVRYEDVDKNDAYKIASKRVDKATGGRYCMLYDSLDKVHEADRYFRGEA
jgi:hypothetical protein